MSNNTYYTATRPPSHRHGNRNPRAVVFHRAPSHVPQTATPSHPPIGCAQSWFGSGFGSGSRTILVRLRSILLCWRRSSSRADGVSPPHTPWLSPYGSLLANQFAWSKHCCLTGQGGVSRVPLQTSIAVIRVLWSPRSEKNSSAFMPRQAACCCQVIV
jgi:hypothetical protein